MSEGDLSDKVGFGDKTVISAHFYVRVAVSTMETLW